MSYCFDVNLCSIISLSNKHGEGISIGNPVVVNINDNDGNQKGRIGELKWIGLINNDKCVGVDMEDEFENGMDGTINGDIRFACLPKHGLITLLSNVKLYNCDKKLYMLENGMINPNKYIKCENGVLLRKFKVDDSVFVRVNTKMGKKKIKGTLKWVGSMNGIRVGAVKLDDDCENGTKGRFWRHILFKCEEKRAVAVLEENIITYTPIKYDRKCFVANSYRFTDEEISREHVNYKIGQLLKAKTNPALYGEATAFMSHCGKCLVGMRLDESQLSVHNNFLRNKIVGKPIFMNDHVGIIVKEKNVEKFKEEIKCLNRSKLIDENSIKYKKENKSNKFQKNDLIKFINNDNVFYKITNFVRINGIDCLEVQEAILPSQRFHVKERDVCKIEHIEKRKSIYDCVLIDPCRIESFERCEFEDLKEGYYVSFRSNDSSKLLKGIINLIGNTDDHLCCVVELTDNIDKEISKYLINERKILNKLCGKTNTPTVIALANVLQKQDCKIWIGGYYTLNPQFVSKIRGQSVDEKFLIFNCINEKSFAKVKWKGLIDKIYCLGCEMKKDEEHGTDGLFIGKQLFNCRNKCGALIPLDDLEECCELTGHKCLKKNENDSIDENCICCVKCVHKFNENNQMKMNDYVERKRKNEYGIIKWIGLVNNVEVIGLESTHKLQQSGTDGTFCGIKLFDCREKCGGLFEASAFTIVKLDLKFLSDVQLNVIDPYSISSIKNGNKVFKSVTLKSKNKTRVLNLKWRGCIKGHLCVGVELDDTIEIGTDGMFNGEKLFQSEIGKGVLIPVKELKGSCESDANHEDIKLHSNDEPFGSFKGFMRFINQDCICCVEWLDHIITHPQMRIGSSVKYKRDNVDIGGTCQWIGLVNSKEAIGARMDDNDQRGSNGRFNNFDLFTCPNGRGFLFLAEDIFHDFLYVSNIMPTEYATPDNFTGNKGNRVLQLCVLGKITEGLHKGIQGSASSCFFYSVIFALFVNSDVLDFMISPMINEIETDEITKRLREVLSWKIIYPLRECGFVDFHGTEEMRDVIEQYESSFADLVLQETDMGNFSLLLGKLCPTEQLLK